MSGSSNRTIEVCLTPALIHLHDLSNATVVVIDVLRATSSMCVAFTQGVKSIVPVATIDESIAYKQKGYLIGAERNGEMLEGFDIGNSPFSYMDGKVKGRDIALTTTNGTQAIAAAKNAKQIVVGSFLNLNALCQWLANQEGNIVLLCSGWKNSVNMEDSLFAGAVVHHMRGDFEFTGLRDTAIIAERLYILAKDDLNGFLEESSHRNRLRKLNIDRDIEYCLTPNQAHVVPGIIDGVMVDLLVQ
ncbi:MAG: 2-phosphosulfolactate phosphatase [Bacteroidota bacterium]